MRSFTVTTNAGNDTVVAAGAAGFTYDGGTGVDTLQINAGVDLIGSNIHFDICRADQPSGWRNQYGCC